MNTRQWMRSIALAVILAAMTVAPRADARGQADQEELMRMTQDILSVIANPPDYTVYDWLTFGIKDKVVYLRGFAHRTSLRSQAPAAVKKVKGVKEVKNEIDYTRTPKSDEQLRRQVYRASMTPLCNPTRKRRCTTPPVRGAPCPAALIRFTSSS